jgi:hypothetical protein
LVRDVGLLCDGHESPRHDVVLVVEELQAAFAGVGDDGVDDTGDAVVHRQLGAVAAELGLHVTGIDQQQRQRIVGVTGREAAGTTD